MKSTQDFRSIIGHYKLSLREKFFFFISGIIISVPFTLFFSKFADYLCIIMPLLYASICSTAVFTPLIEEFAKAYPLFYRHCETERSLFTLGFFVGLGFGFSCNSFSCCKYLNYCVWHRKEKSSTFLSFSRFSSFLK